MASDEKLCEQRCNTEDEVVFVTKSGRKTCSVYIMTGGRNRIAIEAIFCFDAFE
jgi:hypothetical protein